MLTRLTIVLSEQERAALQAMAEREMRGLKGASALPASPRSVPAWITGA